MIEHTYKSDLSKEILDFLMLRKSSVTLKTYRQDCFNLALFDSFLYENKVSKNGITEEIINAWISSFIGKYTNNTINIKISSVRRFSEYLQGNRILAFKPILRKVRDDYIPYIFSDDEVKKIFENIDSIKVITNQPDKDIYLKYPTLVRMIYGCGFRLGEVISLKVKDLDLDLGTVRLRNTKNNKERLVPMHPSLTNILKNYCTLMGLQGKPEEWLFSSADKSQHITERAVRSRFKTILTKAGISVAQRKFQERGPCLHCFRHLFAIKSFKKGETEGHPIDSMVPVLSIYLGHSSLLGTEKYLKFNIPETFQESMELFYNFTDGFFPEVKYEE